MILTDFYRFEKLPIQKANLELIAQPQQVVITLWRY